MNSKQFTLVEIYTFACESRILLENKKNTMMHNYEKLCF